MYKIVGADNQEYGPVSREEILQWIAQGRANAKTVARLEDGAWKPLATFDEFKAALNIPPAIPTSSPGSFPSSGLPTERKANSSAITALVCGILGVVCCSCASPVAIVLGVTSLNQIKANPTAYSTDPSLPKIAIGLGITGVVLMILGAIWVMVGGGLSFLQEFQK